MVYFLPPLPFNLLMISTSYPNIVATAWITGTLITFVASMVKDLRILAVEDPPPPPNR
jgi:hypothetical protein